MNDFLKFTSKDNTSFEVSRAHSSIFINEEDYQPLISSKPKKKNISQSDKALMENILNGDIHYSYELCKNDLKKKIKFFYLNCLMLFAILFAEFALDYGIYKRYYLNFENDKTKFSKIIFDFRKKNRERIFGVVSQEYFTLVFKNIFLSFRIFELLACLSYYLVVCLSLEMKGLYLFSKVLYFCAIKLVFGAFNLLILDDFLSRVEISLNVTCFAYLEFLRRSLTQIMEILI